MSLISWIFRYDFYKYYYKHVQCYSCRLNIKVNQNQPYVYKIKGIGKLHNKFVCHNCLQEKLLKTKYIQ